MRVILAPAHLSTHVTELVPLAWSLAVAGNEVLIAGAPDITATALRAGLHFAEIGTPVRMVERAAGHLPPDLFPATALGDRSTSDGQALWAQCAAGFAGPALEHGAEYLDLARDWRPDLVISDSMALAGWVLAAGAGVPAVHVHCGVAPLLGPFTRAASELLDPVRERFGLRDPAAPDLVLDPCPASLQAPDAPPGERMRYVPFNGAGVRPDRAARGDRPRICVTAGTVLAWTGPELLRRMLDAVLTAADEAEIVLTAAPDAVRGLGRVPTEVRVLTGMPLSLFLPGSDLIVHHGGTATGLTAAAFGVPQLVLPQWGNAFDFGRALAAHGAGRSVPDRDGQHDATGLAASVRALLDEPVYQQQADDLREEIGSAPSLAATARRLERLVAGTPA